ETPCGGLTFAAYERGDFRVGRGVERACLFGRGGRLSESAFELINRNLSRSARAREQRPFASDVCGKSLDEPARRASSTQRFERGVHELVSRSRVEDAATP